MLHVREHFGLAPGLIDLESRGLLLATDRQRARGAGVQQRDELLRRSRRSGAAARRARFTARSSASARIRRPDAATSGSRAVLRDHLTSALPTTAASAERQACATCSGDEMPNPIASGSEDCARTRSIRPLTSAAETVAHAGHAEPRDHVEKSATELPGLPDPLVGCGRAR